MNADGTDLRKLTDNAFIDREPAFSPVENIIAYTSDQDSPELTEIYLLRLGEADSEPTIERLTNASGSSYSPSWSQNGVFLVFANDRTGSGDIYRAEAARPGSEILMTIDGREIENRRPSVSPDGRWVAFTSNRDGEGFQTYITDGFEVNRLTNNGRDDLDVIFRPLGSDIFPTQ
jgi:TolB protein